MNNVALISYRSYGFYWYIWQPETGLNKHSHINTHTILGLQIQVGQLSQTNRAAAWVSFGKNLSEKSVHLTSLCYTAQNIFRNAETFRRVHQ